MDLKRLERGRNRALLGGVLLFAIYVALHLWLPTSSLGSIAALAAGTAFATAGYYVRALRRVKAATAAPRPAWLGPPSIRVPAAPRGRARGSFAVEIVVGIERTPQGLPLDRIGGERAAPDGRERPGWVAVRCELGEAAAYGVPVRTLPFGDEPVMEELPEEHLRAAFAQARGAHLPNGTEPRLYLAFRGVN